jgi:cellulose synthase/poly-beta-1,6-N-acetylglucosamine synthase-like glycosyltransferase
MSLASVGLIWVTCGSLLLAALLLVPTLVVSVECLAALLPARRAARHAVGAKVRRPPVVVLIPAHDEAIDLPQTLEGLHDEMRPDDRVLVVADNCTDTTAGIARSLGATVIERADPDHRGKGFALDFGVRHIAGAGQPPPPPVVIVLDADCAVGAGALDELAIAAVAHDRPVQGLYLMESAAAATSARRVSALAFLVRNHVRPRGMNRLNLPCPLTGSGMAFPWDVLRGARLATDSIVEDMQIGLELACCGKAAVFCEAARITGRLPTDRRAARVQRRRWEHGHLHTALEQIPRLIAAGVRQRALAPIALALDLSVPPLSLLVMLVATSLIVAATSADALHASWVPSIILSAEFSLLLAALALAWLAFARRTLPLRSLLLAPWYAVSKVPMYLSFPFRRESTWVRTARDARPPQHEPEPVSSTSASPR